MKKLCFFFLFALWAGAALAATQNIQIQNSSIQASSGGILDIGVLEGRGGSNDSQKVKLQNAQIHVQGEHVKINSIQDARKRGY